MSECQCPCSMPGYWEGVKDAWLMHLNYATCFLCESSDSSFESGEMAGWQRLGKIMALSLYPFMCCCILPFMTCIACCCGTPEVRSDNQQQKSIQQQNNQPKEVQPMQV